MFGWTILQDAPKSSTKPRQVQALEGLSVGHVATGYAHTLLIATNDAKLKVCAPTIAGRGASAARSHALSLAVAVASAASGCAVPV